jgi:hypothetical protein
MDRRDGDAPLIYSSCRSPSNVDLVKGKMVAFVHQRYYPIGVYSAAALSGRIHSGRLLLAPGSEESSEFFKYIGPLLASPWLRQFSEPG